MKVNIKGCIVSSQDGWIYDWLGIENCTPKQVCTSLEKAAGADIDVYINSSGGDIFAGSEIYESLRQYSGRCTIHVVGIAASAASVIACARTSEIAPTGMIMVHNVSGSSCGDYHSMDKESEILRKANKTIEQLAAIKNEDCFGSNRIYKLFDKTIWRPKYYVIQDKYDSTKGVYDNLDIEYLFISDFYWKEHGMSNPNAICYHIERTLKQTSELPFSDDCSKFIQSASTVTFTMIQLACYMGYKEIYLIGMDHTYANVTNDKGVIIQKNKVKSHVFDDEQPNEVVANISYMEDAYRTARRYCEAHGVSIYNATLGGALEIFKRVDFGSII